MSRRTKRWNSPRRQRRRENRNLSLIRPRFEQLEDRRLLSVTATNVGVGPGAHLEALDLHADDDQNWYRFELLKNDNIDVQIAFEHVSGNLDLEVRDAAGTLLGVSTSTTDDETVALTGLAAGTYYVHISSPGGDTNRYDLSLVPGDGSTTRVLYVNDSETAGNVYTTAIGDDLNNGLTAATPKASVQALLTDYNLGPHDLVVIDTGEYSKGTVLVTSDDEGASFAGSPAGSQFTHWGTRWEFADADYNLVYGLTFSGSQDGIGIHTHGNGVYKSTNNNFRANTFTGTSLAIFIDSGNSDLLIDNVVSGSGSGGFSIKNSESVSILGNSLQDRSTGISVFKSSLAIKANTLSQHTTGIRIDDQTAVATVDGNDISTSTTGIESHYSGANLTIRGNEIHHNTTGISSVGTVGGAGWSDGQANNIHHNTTGVIAWYDAEVRFNRVFSNQVGVKTRDAVNVHHNLIYRNATTGLLIDDGDGAIVTNNTVYAAIGDGVHVQNTTQNITLRNNIIWAEAGTGLRVDTDSQQGFDSDYNNLFSTGTGTAVWWQKDFSDLFDWQTEADYDNHSIGTTSLNPGLDNPQFVDLAGNDFHLVAIHSTSIDAGDPTRLAGSEPSPNGGRINLGAFGGTTEAAVSRGASVQIDFPNFYTDLEAGAGQVITWHTFDASGSDDQVPGEIDIDLIEEGVGKVADIATVTATEGSVGWTPQSHGFTGDIFSRYRIRITSLDNPALTDLSREVFSIVPDSNLFYVDDGSNANDQYTPTAVGNNRNTGQSVTDPKRVLLSLLRSYNLNSTDTVFIDTGTYQHVRNTIISGATGVGDDEGGTFTGPNPSEAGFLAGMTAVIDRGNTYAGSTNIELTDADYVTLQYLTLTGAERGLWVHNGSTRFSGDHLTVSDNAGNGLTVESDAAMAQISSITAFDNGDHGIYIATPIVRLSNSESYNNRIGIYVENDQEVNPTVVGAADSLGNTDLAFNTGTTPGNAGNRVYDNAETGILASHNVLVFGNTIFGHSGSSDSGISLVSGAIAQANIVHDNDYGVRISDGLASENRVYNNGTGILLEHDASARGNQVYSNSIGILSYNPQSVRSSIENNLVYANSSHGIVLQRARSGTWIANNTVYQELGDAVRIENSSSGVHLRNNILWVETGSAISVAARSQRGFDSNDNLLYATGTGTVGRWQDIDQAQLGNWQAATFADGNSFSQDPLFVNRRGEDDHLGYFDAASDGRDDDFHLMSQYGRFTGSLAPVLDAEIGLPILLPSSETSDVLQSPAIDRGNVAYPFVNEPSPNGNFINLGAFGNTKQASKSPAEYLLVTRPDGGEVWPADKTFFVGWRSAQLNPTTFVDIQLVRDTDPEFSYPIANNTENDSLFVWTIPDDSLLIPPATDYRVRITRTDNGLLTDVSGTVFTITEPITDYYVNQAGDSDFSDNEYTSAAGSNGNDGLSPATPKTSVRAILEAYDLNPGDTILVDTGVYKLSTNIRLTSREKGITIQGPTGAGHQALLDRANTSFGSYVFELVDADGITLDHLGITGGQAGVYATSVGDSDNVTIQNSEIFGNEYYGIQLLSGNSGAAILNNTIHEQTYSSGGTIGITLDRASGATVTGNTVYGHTTGIKVQGLSINEKVTIGGNSVFANSYVGISVVGDVLVVDNMVYDHNKSNGIGISLSYGAEARRNVVHGNHAGIHDNNGREVIENRVFNNEIGIVLKDGASALGNQIYSNATGILGDNFTGKIKNNLIYANSNQAVVLQSARGSAEIVGNTIYQEVGDAIALREDSSSVLLQNNILWVDEGFAISVDGDSLRGFDSDYNLLRTTGGGKLGNWGDNEALDLDNWFYELGQDEHSRIDDPRFIDFDGSNDILGYDTTPIGEAVILDDSDTGVTRFGSWTETVGDEGHSSDYWTTDDRNASITWEFTDLEPGTYQIAATWIDGNYTRSARYTVTEGGQYKTHAVADQRNNTPSDFTDAGVGWENLETVDVEGDSLTITLTNTNEWYDLVADAVRIVRIEGDCGIDDNFHLENNSPAIDRGDPWSLFMAEPSPNGSRVNLGRYGDTSQAAISPMQMVQVISPNGLENFEVGQPVTIDWQSDGLSLDHLVVLSNVGNSGAVDEWRNNPFLVDRDWYNTFPQAVDLSAVTHPAPESVYQTYDIAMTSRLVYRLPVADGTYDVRLHFAEPLTTIVGSRLFDIRLNGSLVQDDFDILAAAGARYKATTLTLTGTAIGGNGLLLELKKKSASLDAILSGVEVTSVNPSGVANPTVDLQWSADGGGSFSTIASDLPMDRFGRGSYTWPPPSETNQGVIRVTANDGTLPRDDSDNVFQIANAGRAYYVNTQNDTDFSDNEYTSAAGNNANSGKTADSPMASLVAILAAYDLDPGDTVFVDTGVYTRSTNMVVTADDAGVTIQGSTNAGHRTVFDRANMAEGSYVFELLDADGITLDSLGITGGYVGVYASDTSDSDAVTIRNSYIFGNYLIGIHLKHSNDDAVIVRNTIHDQAIRMSTGIAVEEASGVTVSENTVYANGTGINVRAHDVAETATISGNAVFDNHNTGIQASHDVVVFGNTVYGHDLAAGTGIRVSNGTEARQNVVHGNSIGIRGNGFGLVSKNRVYDNETGVSLFFSTTAQENQVYSNSIGILGTSFTGKIRNNLVYANTNQEILVQGAHPGAEVTNNTVYQEVGDAIRIEANSDGILLRNNILWVDEGFAISVATDSLRRFDSDYNLLRTTGAGKFGNWAGFEFASLVDWFHELGQDEHSRTGDPQFIDFDGADNILGYETTPIGAAIILDDEDMGVTLSRSWTESINSESYGHDYWTNDDLADSAVWEFTGLTPGTYQVATTWVRGRFSQSALYTITEAAERKRHAQVSQFYRSPNDFIDAGVGWKNLGTVTIDGDSLTVTLTNADDSHDVVADAMRIQQIEGDHGSDNDVHLENTSPVIDAGDPQSLFLGEPSPNGGRVNLGRYGNTNDATASPMQLVQILSPNGLEKPEVGQPLTIDWRSAGLTLVQQVALSNVGEGGAIGDWHDNPFLVESDWHGNFLKTVDLSAVPNPAPESVYQTYDYAYPGTGNRLAYRLPVADGMYDVRLHFAEPSTTLVDDRLFDIFLNGSLVQDNFDIVATTGERGKATTLTFTHAATGDNGLLLELVNESSSYGAILLGIEITTANPSGVANPTVDLQWSADGGGSFTTIAAGLAMDRFGQGRYAWTAPSATDHGVIRVIANQGTLPSDDSDGLFQIGAAGTTYYVNTREDADFSDNEYTSAAGNNANSGKSGNAPVASLATLLAAYDLEPGDTILVDTGRYTLPANVIITSDDAGVTIQGPTGTDHEAVFDRASMASNSYAFELRNADAITLEDLSITGGHVGIYAGDSGDSDDVTIQNCHVFGNGAVGISHGTGNDRATILGNTIHDQTNNQSTGIFVDHASDTIVRGNTVHGNSIGINAIGHQAIETITIVGNTVFDNGDTGILANDDVLVVGNTVYSHDGSNGTGINVSSGATARQNIAYNNDYGIRSHDGSVIQNRVYNNETGIWLERTATARANRVYSNSIGILGSHDNGFTGQIENNLVYVNANQGIVLRHAHSDAKVRGNTIYQEVGDAVRIENDSHDVRLRNNILWIDEGFDLFVAADSLQGFDSDRNLLHQSNDPNARVAYWGGIEADSLDDWQATSGQGTHSTEGNPLFVDWAGADNVMGYTSDGEGYDGGEDDNWLLMAGSPAIDRAGSWDSPRTDIDGTPRLDDPGTANLGSDQYFETDLGTHPFPLNGIAQDFHDDNDLLTLDFTTLANPAFTFDFYGTTHTNVYVSSNGFLQFNTISGFHDDSNTLDEFIQYARIAPLWDDLSTTGDGDIFIDDSLADRVTIRWAATNQADGSPVNMAVTLWDTGRITMDYGAGNTNLTPTIGISAGDGRHYVVSTLDGNPMLTEANTQQFDLQPGFVDMGAYEFRGSSFDVIPPTVIDTHPTVVRNEGMTGTPLSQIELVFSEALNNIDAAAPANYELRGAGPNSTFDDDDDVIFPLTVSYTTGSTRVSLDVINGTLPIDDYQLTVSGTASIHDLAGLRLDGKADGSEGSDYVRTFAIVEVKTDFDSDGDVDGSDFLAWQRGFGTTSGATPADGDANGDEAVDAVDLGIWHSQFGTTPIENPPVEEEADFDADTDVDGSDFLAWQRGFGATSGATPADGDANGDETVNAVDLGIWQNQFGTNTSIPAGAEPLVNQILVSSIVSHTSSLPALEVAPFQKARSWQGRTGVDTASLTLFEVALICHEPPNDTEKTTIVSKREAFQYKPEAQASDSVSHGKTHSLALRACISATSKRPATVASEVNSVKQIELEAPVASALGLWESRTSHAMGPIQPLVSPSAVVSAHMLPIDRHQTAFSSQPALVNEPAIAAEAIDEVLTQGLPTLSPVARHLDHLIVHRTLQQQAAQDQTVPNLLDHFWARRDPFGP